MLNEVVYADKNKINTKKKTIGLTYTKNNRASDNANPFDKLGTEEMDQDNSNTIEVPLKGGLISYNITDIKGVEIMHYFKKKWAQRQRVTMDVKSQDGSTDVYDLQMDSNEERNFIDRFVKKVEMVINAWIVKNKPQDDNFKQISILPVHSTSCFNKTFVKNELMRLNINGLPCVMVDPEIIIKDLKNIKRDEDFINKNKEFYNSDYALGKPEMGTVKQKVDNIINKNNALKIVDDIIPKINFYADKLRIFLNNNKNLTELTPRQIKNLTDAYKEYADGIRKCYSISYKDTINNNTHSCNHNQIITAIKYSKGPSIDKRSTILWNMVKPYIRGEKSAIDGKPYIETPLCYWKKVDFEIKTLRNSERLGLKDIYSVNYKIDEKRRNDEIEKMKNTILLVFDDNISGGATLSDVCMQCKNLGANYIIPITFGKMNESNTMRGIMLNTPKNGYDFSTNKNLSLYNGPEKNKRVYIKKNERLNNGKQQFYNVFNIDSNLPVINILWLDDIREPYSYFANKRQSGAWIRNYEYYNNNIFNRYNPNFIWVKNLDEFKDYIIKNDLPDMVSFDHDIRPKNYYGQHETGADVAQWLIEYCQKNNLQLPLSMAHSANKNGAQHINDILNSYQNNMYENKQTIKLSENKLKKIIKESVYKILFKN